MESVSFRFPIAACSIAAYHLLLPLNFNMNEIRVGKEIQGTISAWKWMSLSTCETQMEAGPRWFCKGSIGWLGSWLCSPAPLAALPELGVGTAGDSPPLFLWWLRTGICPWMRKQPFSSKWPLLGSAVFLKLVLCSCSVLRLEGVSSKWSVLRNTGSLQYIGCSVLYTPVWS